MKKTILGAILFVFICIGMVLSFSSFKTTIQSENIVVVQVYEIYSSLTVNPRIIVSDGTKILKTIELEATKGKNIEENLIKVTTTLNEIKNQGYSITGSCNNPIVGSTTYVFEKK